MRHVWRLIQVMRSESPTSLAPTATIHSPSTPEARDLPAASNSPPVSQQPRARTARAETTQHSSRPLKRGLKNPWKFGSKVSSPETVCN
jgi:hypothetical protein